MRALVTGGAGFIGSNLVRLLVDRGADVRVLDDLSTGFRDNLRGSGAELVIGDVRDRDAVLGATRGVDLVFHLAASVGNARSIADPATDSEVNVIGTIHVLEAAREHRIDRLVYSSSAGVFGEVQELPIAEDHPREPVSPYGVSKLAGEKMCLVYGALHGIETVCLRYFNVYGPHQRYDEYGNVIPIFVERLLDGSPLTVFGDGEQTRDFVHARDVARANLAAATTPGVEGVFNIASGERITINRLAELLEGISDVPLVIEHGPERPGDVRHSLADVSAAREAFGYAPSVDLEKGLRDYVEGAASVRDTTRGVHEEVR